jgi:HEPN domain-containing protein
MSRESLIRLRQSDEPGKVPSVEQLELGELAANTYDGRLYLKQAQEDFEQIVTFVGKVPIKNTIFLQKNGNDTNNGDSWDSAVSTFERALELAELRDGELTLIDVGPGEYITQGHLDIPDDTLIRAAHRSVVIKPEPGYEERNVFRMGSGCFIEGPVFQGWRIDDLENPTEGFAICFRPGALITRVPYVHKIVVRSERYWDTVAPPLDRKNQNPLIGRGGGVALADGAVLSPYSIFPNIMTWGATPVAHNGIGYCAKNGALINAVNAVSLWAHKHFYALDGGQIVLSSCSTQFGDFTMVSKGTRNLVFPQENKNTFILDPIRINEVTIVSPTTITETLSAQTQAALAIEAAAETIIDNLWLELVSNEYTTTWNEEDEAFTRRDAQLFLTAMAKTLETANEDYMLDFARSLFYIGDIPVFTEDKLAAFVFSFNYMRDQINDLEDVGSTAQTLVAALVAALNDTLENTVIIPVVLSVQEDAATEILNAKQDIIDSLWTALEDNSYTQGWTESDELYTRRDARTFINALVDALRVQNDIRISGFVRDLFYADKTSVFSADKLSAFIFSFNYIREYINQELTTNEASQRIVEGLTTAVVFTLKYPEFIKVVIPRNLEGALSVVPVRVNDVSIVIPDQIVEELTVQTDAADAILENLSDIVDSLWPELVSNEYTTTWSEEDEAFTRRDAQLFLTSMAKTLETSNEDYMLDFARSLFFADGTEVFTEDKLAAFVFSFNYMRDQINDLEAVGSTAQTLITVLVAALNTTIQTPIIVPITLETDSSAAVNILNAKQDIIDSLWIALEDNSYTTTWNNEDEEFIRRDAEIFLNAVSRAFISGDDLRIVNFIESLFKINGTFAFASSKLDAYIFSFNYIRAYINRELDLDINSQNITEGLANTVVFTLRYPIFDNAIGVNLTAAAAIDSARDDIIDRLWQALEDNGYTEGWLPKDEEFTRRDAATFIQSISWVIQTGNEKPILDFVKGLFDYNGVPVFSEDKLVAFIFSFNYIRDEINSLPEALQSIDNIVIALVTAVSTTLQKTVTRLEPSIITAIGHTWSGIMAGVALTKIPPARNLTTIQESILELNQGVVISSGQDDQGSALFVGGLEINADTGELTGPPFDQAVNRIATRAVIARSY